MNLTVFKETWGNHRVQQTASYLRTNFMDWPAKVAGQIDEKRIELQTKEDKKAKPRSIRKIS
jgi:hypothetical protein